MRGDRGEVTATALAKEGPRVGRSLTPESRVEIRPADHRLHQRLRGGRAGEDRERQDCALCAQGPKCAGNPQWGAERSGLRRHNEQKEISH